MTDRTETTAALSTSAKCAKENGKSYKPAPAWTRAEIEEMAAGADRLAQKMNRRFVLNQEKVDRYLAHNEGIDHG